MKSSTAKEAEKFILGNEPSWNKDSDITLTRALNWYSYFSDSNDSKQFTLNYLKQINSEKDAIELINTLPDYHFSNLGFVCRMKQRGAPLTDKNIQWIDSEIKQLINLAKSSHQHQSQTTPSIQISIQERLQDKTSQYIGEIEGIIDDCIYSKQFAFDAYDWMNANSIKGAHAKIILSFFESRLTEINEAILGKDKDLVDGYSFLKKTELKNYAKLLDSIIGDCNKIIHNTKITRVPRKKKAKSADKIVSKIQYKKEDSEYKIASVNPIDLVGSSQVWIFNTKTRKLGCYIANDKDGLSIKGTTITNFNEEQSIQKTVRKPDVTLPTVISSGKVSLKKILPNINAVGQKLTGRLNSDTILLRIIK
jgi:hypothetical protein